MSGRETIHFSISSASPPIKSDICDAAMAVDNERHLLSDLTDQIIPCAGASPFDGGGYANVFLAKWKRSQGTELVAVKVLRTHTVGNEECVVKLERHLQKELRVWEQLHHPNIIFLHGTCTNFGPYAMVSPWYKNGNLSSYLKTLGLGATVEIQFRLICGAARGLMYLHSMDPPIVHGDITCVNILVDDNGEARLCDFGLSKILEPMDTSTTTLTSTAFAGSVRYVAPELYRQFTRDGDPVLRSCCTDVYSYGCVAYQVLTGLIPYHNIRSNAEVIIKICLRSPVPPLPKGSLQDNWWVYIKLCCSERPQERPTMDEVVSTFEVFRMELID